MARGQKKHNFRVISLYRCSCGNLLKLNVTSRKEHPEKLVCYRCHVKAESRRGHKMKEPKPLAAQV